jgi:GNAT superfamily N-acetyltransferase
VALDLRPYLRSDDAQGRILDEIDGLLARAYGAGSMRARVERFLALQPQGWVLARDVDGLVGVGGCIAYPDAGFGWVGLIATDPSIERRGIGTAITNWLVDVLRSLDCASVLDASGPGAPLYRRMGFQDYGTTVVMTAEALVLPPTAYVAIRVQSADHLVTDDLFAYDRARFGADRSRLFRYMLEVDRCPTFAVLRDGAVCAFAMVQDDAIGPMVADDQDALAAVLNAAAEVSAARPIRLRVSSESSWGTVLEAWGFRAVRTLAHQRLGIAALPGRRDLLASQTSFGEG